MKRLVVWVIGILLLTCLAGCKRKTPVAAAPPPPQAAAPEVVKPNAPVISEFTAEPSRVERGQTALLRWQVKDATEIEINHGVGTVPASGRRRIQSDETTTYTLVAKGPGGAATADTTLSVTLPPPPPAVPTKTVPSISERLNSEVRDALFDYDRSNIREDAEAVLSKDAAALKSIMSDYPNVTVIIEGHCDERGSAEYNLALGDRRASAAKEFLTQLGVPGDRLIKVSYGKERPVCTESNEACWQKNRRAHFAPGENQTPKVSGELNEPGVTTGTAAARQ